MRGNDTLNNLYILNNMYCQSFYFHMFEFTFVIDTEKPLRGSTQ